MYLIDALFFGWMMMISSGGAVQGLREPIPDQESIYLNRANDGFVFFDNGCYTSGPLQLGSDEIYLCSIMVGNDKSRVVMYGNGDPDRNKFTLQWKNTGALFDKNPPTLQMEPVPCDLKINFGIGLPYFPRRDGTFDFKYYR